VIIIKSKYFDLKEYTKILKIIGVIFSLLLLVLVYYETKMLDLILGIFKVEVLKEEIAKVSLKSLMFITKSDETDILVQKMNLLGWQFEDSYGRGFLFSKHREEILLVRKHHLKYYIYEIQGKEFFMSKNS
jgi:hypothetical protein